MCRLEDGLSVQNLSCEDTVTSSQILQNLVICECSCFICLEQQYVLSITMEKTGLRKCLQIGHDHLFQNLLKVIVHNHLCLILHVL